MITIFTPAYNRAYILPKLYESLCAQTSKNFEWLVVDDGSTDETEELIANFKSQVSKNKPSFEIRYFKQENGGKHRAINRGVQEAHGELFFIVDSDDHLSADAVEWISKTWSELGNDKSFAGLSGIRIMQDGTKIGGGEDFGMIDATSLDIRYKHHVGGDLAEIYRTDVMRKFPFPDIPGEKFCTEALVWDRIAETGLKLRYIYKGIYVGGYLPDGLSAKQRKIRRESPEYSMLYDSEGAKRKCAPLRFRVKRAIKFWEFAGDSQKSFKEKCRMIGWPWILFYPVGLIYRYF